ncbi:glycerophosphodiester phosphodiesterase family protein [Bradyrhizobium iriomotense]|uniref:Glycerophosphodiester phosphodiesterase n=1 Tax=Bradyrhizobium iriomotense TaxID=441950 RepID=A0ABQ6BFN7_9BRAD|nr:glycerophosphodiester phosphodiesterase family protein [Bradyrhizobium iriomotense]GLR90983.1 glycerophosphodiester phosphodiesterase [Bradyrhizobium iriomotense]
MTKCTSITTKALGTAALALTFVTGAALAGQYNTDKIGEVLLHSRRDLTLVCAHRGLHGTLVGTNIHIPEIRDIPENSRAAIKAAADKNIECLEIDLRSTNWGDVIVLHDTKLGRTTNVGAVNGMQNYDPYSDTGYNPLLSEYYFSPEELKLRTPSANVNSVSKENLPSLGDILEYIDNNRIAIILFLDIRDVDTARSAWEIVKRHKNAWGTPASKWVYFKMNVSKIGAATPADFEKLGIFDPKSEAGSFRFIPGVLASFIDTSRGTDQALQNWRAYYERPYVWGTELIVKQYDDRLSFPLNNIINAYSALRTTGYPKVMGNYQPVPETKNYQYFSHRGQCCVTPTDWYWKSKFGYGEDTADHREDLNWMIDVAGSSYGYVLSDDPLTAIETLKKANRRNTSVIWND